MDKFTTSSILYTIPDWMKNLSLSELRAHAEYAFNPATMRAYNSRVRELAIEDAAQRSEKLIAARAQRASIAREARAHHGTPLVSESATETIAETIAPETITNVIDVAASAEDSAVGVTAPSYDIGVDNLSVLTEFFERPFMIYNANWTIGSDYSIALDVWKLWSDDPTVRAKLSNFAFFRGDLNVRIVINGTPYHYGCIMASYIPYPYYNQTLTAYDELFASTTPTDSVVYRPYRTYLSQQLGVKYLQAGENKPLEMKIPFVSHKPRFRLYNDAGTLITNAVAFDDFEDAGQLRLLTINPIAVATDAYAPPISVAVYVWASDVQLGGFTATDIDLTAESKTETVSKKKKRKRPMTANKPLHMKVLDSVQGAARGDEYEDAGPVESISSAVTKVGDALSDVPVIGSFARATAGIARGVGRFAHMFGFSRPVILDTIVLQKALLDSPGAVTAGHDAAFKLTVDPKQELTIDQSIGGADGPDEMAIKVIAARESFLTTISWSDTDTPLTTIKWTGYVSPVTFSACSMPTGKLLQPSALFFAARPFTFWRGTIIYRFEIECTKFHRGKLLIRYEPNVRMRGLISSSTVKLNQENSIVIDLQETRSFEISVDWCNPREWCANQTSTGTLATSYSSCDIAGVVNADSAPKQAYYNGYLEVRPFTDLVQPTATADVKINVYQRCEDLEVAVPHRNFGDPHLIYFSESLTINENVTDDTDIHLSHFGEKIESFRALLKRYAPYYYTSFTTTAVNQGLQLTLDVPPRGARYFYNGLDTSTTYRTSLHAYLNLAYMAYRGGFRYRVRYLTPNSRAWVRAMTGTPNSSDYFTATAASPVVFSGEQFPLLSNPAGAEYTEMSYNPGFTFEAPFQSQELYRYTSLTSNPCSDVDGGYMDLSTKAVIVDCQTNSAVDENHYVGVDICSAEDFTFLRFTGAPIVQTNT